MLDSPPPSAVMSEPSMFHADFAIVTIVDEARDAAIETFGVRPEGWQDKSGIRWATAFVSASDGGKHLVVIGQAADRSNLPAFEIASSMLRSWRPRHLVLVDIGGGIWGGGASSRDGIALGDVVVASDIEYFEVEKEKDGRAVPRDFARMLPSLGPRTALRTISHWDKEWHRAEQGTSLPKVMDGQVVCGEKLLADPNSMLVGRIVGRYDKALVVDMESAGVARAVLSCQDEGIFAQFTVLRGISDFIDHKDIDNQNTRDLWKPISAQRAIRAAAAWIRSCPSQKGVAASPDRPDAFGESANAVVVLPPSLSSYAERMRSWLREAIPAPERAFTLKIVGTNCRAVGSQAPFPGQSVSKGAILDLALNDRKVAIIGPSGAGKSMLLRQIVRQVAPDAATIPVYVDLKANWRAEWGNALVDLPTEHSVSASVNALLKGSALAPTTTGLGECPEGHSILLVVDALNEVPADAAQKIRDALEQYARFNQRVRLLVSDRRIEPSYRESLWTVVRLEGVGEDEARETVDHHFGEGAFESALESDRRILCVPFFLDLAIRSRRLTFGSRANAVGTFLSASGVTPNEIAQLSCVAFRVYQSGESVLSTRDVDDLGGPLVEKLRSSEVLLKAPDWIFSHQLIHQYLAGTYLGTNPVLWEPRTLDHITAKAASLDSVGMTIAAVDDQSERDRFLRIVFDWNWRAAILALGQALAGDRPVSELLAVALLSTAAEKRFDAVRGTRARIDGLLREARTPVAERLLLIKSIAEAVDMVRAIPPTDVPWWNTWREVFVRQDREGALSERAVPSIGSAEPIVGWTAANVLRRFEQTDVAAASVRAIYRSQLRRDSACDATRWRVVHTLGAWPSVSNAELLFEALGDSYMWVSYGAVRSLVEMAARCNARSLRDLIVGELERRWRALRQEPLSQIAWTALYRDADAQWPAAIQPLLEEIRNSHTGAERDKWNRRLEHFDEYVAQHVGGSAR